MVLKVKLENTNAYRVLCESPYACYASNFGLFRKEIQDLFALENDDFDILYLDSDGDLVILSSYSEIHDIHPQKKNCRLIVRPKTIDINGKMEPNGSTPSLSEESLQPMSSSFTSGTTAHNTAAPSDNPKTESRPVPPPGFTAFAQCLQSALNQWTNDFAPIQQRAAQRSQEQARQVSGFALGVLDNALRTAAETATNIHQTVSPVLQRHASYSNYRQHHHRHQQQPTPQTTSTSSEEDSKATMYCDICYKLIPSEHWACIQCTDYHVCIQCRSNGAVFHTPWHEFQHVETAQNSSDDPLHHAINLKNTDTIHDNVLCDCCGTTIVGIRYKCGHCPDFDLCETCESRQVHDQQHVFLKIRRPLSPTRRMVTTFLPVFDYAVKSTESTTHEKPEANPANIDTPIEQQSLSHEQTSASFGTSNGLLSAVFVDDVNLPDGSEMQPSQRFLKVWKIKNNGRVRWPVGSSLIFSGGDILRPYPPQYQQSGVVPSIAPDEEARIAIELSAPDTYGRHVGYFRLSSPEGIRFGDRLWCDINVAALPNTYSMKHTLAQSTFQKRISSASSPLIGPTIQPPMTSMVYPAPSTSHGDTVDNRRHSSCMITTPTEPSVCTTTTHDNGSIGYGTDNDDFDPFQDPYIIRRDSAHASSHSIGSQTETVHNDQHRAPTCESRTPISGSSCTEFVLVKNHGLQQDQRVPEYHHSSTYYPSSSIPNEKSPLSASLSNSNTMDGYEWIRTNNQHAFATNDFKYGQQLARLHEMGITYCDELAIELLIQHQGNLDIVLPEILDLA